jgi:hypothetical protein
MVSINFSTRRPISSALAGVAMADIDDSCAA